MKLKVKGFTLLELMVAISIFSVLGLGSYQMLQSVSRSHDRVRDSVTGYTKANLALSIIQRDFNQFSPRQIRDEYGEPLAPLVFDNGDFLVEFTRSGWMNPAGRQRSELQRVAYSLDYDEEKLFRHFWKVLDRAEDSEPVSQLLLEGVTDFRVTGFTGDALGEESDFSLDGAGAAAPLAVEVTIATKALGEVQRLFQLVEPYVVTDRQNSANRDEDDTDDGEDAGDTGADTRTETRTETEEANGS